MHGLPSIPTSLGSPPRPPLPISAALRRESLFMQLALIAKPRPKSSLGAPASRAVDFQRSEVQPFGIRVANLERMPCDPLETPCRGVTVAAPGAGGRPDGPPAKPAAANDRCGAPTRRGASKSIFSGASPALWGCRCRLSSLWHYHALPSVSCCILVFVLTFKLVMR